MFLCGMVDNAPRWPWDNKRYVKRPKLRQLYTRMSGSFFHKGISRMQAEMALTRAGEDGSFLVRDSESLTGAYVLCVLFQSKVHQYRVLPGPDNKLHVQSETGTIQRGYHDLTELIAEYVKKADQNGLASALIHPVPPEGPDDPETDDDDDDDDDFESPIFQKPLPAHSHQRTSLLREPEKVDLLKNFSKLDLSCCEGGFTSSIKDYVETGFQKDSKAFSSGESELPEFKRLLEKSAEGLRREMVHFTQKLNILNDLLGVGDNRSLARDLKRGMGAGLPGMLEYMTRLHSEVMAIQTKAQETAQYAAVPPEYEYLDIPSLKEANGQISNCSPFLSSHYRPYIPQSKFEVSKVRHGRATDKITLTVDLQTGKYSILKPSSKSELDQQTVSHDRILHLIKSTREKRSLDVIVEGKRKQTYQFADPHTRENFCVQIRQMKNMHSTETEIDQISLFVGTWNMGDSPPNQSLNTWLRCNGNGKSRDRVMAVIPHDIYVIGTQESSLTEKEWTNSLKAGLKACVMVDMELVEVLTLWGIRLAVLVKPEHKSYINRIQRASVRTGIANALGNKGAVAISFYFQGTSFCFINSHLTSGNERLNRRNQNYRDIIKSLTMSMGQKHLGVFDITNQFHHVFWLGDINYRLEEDVQVILHKIQDKDLASLLEKDQLRRVQREKVAFCGFKEAEITFLPTYRLERNMTGHKYAWKKVKPTGERINVPSWCDRVLWRSYPEVFIENVAYGCSDAILSSDHRPVFSSFNVGIMSEFIQSRGSLAEMAPVKMTIHSIEAQVKTCCKQYFQLSFHSTCLQESYKSKPNLRFNENRTSFFTVAVWEALQLPELKLLFGDQDYLEEQHIQVAVVSKEDDNESYGECILPLKNLFSDKPQEFEYILLHQGEETGKLKGRMHITSHQQVQQEGRSSSRKALYSLIAFDTEYRDPEMFNPDQPSLELRRAVKSCGPTTVMSHSSTMSTKHFTIKGTEEAGPGVYETIDLGPPEVPNMSKLDRRAPQPLPSHPPPRKSPGVPGMGLPTGSQRPAPSMPRQTSGSQAPQAAPPPIPKKSFARGMATMEFRYDEIKRPSTLEDWLAGLNLSCYEQNFITNGWDSLQFLAEITTSDLQDMSITISDHQERILNSIQTLNRK